MTGNANLNQSENSIVKTKRVKIWVRRSKIDEEFAEITLDAPEHYTESDIERFFNGRQLQFKVLERGIELEYLPGDANEEYHTDVSLEEDNLPLTEQPTLQLHWINEDEYEIR